ncbi:hypothetical protein CALVIDRAFT_525848 [Calocera viscosa TUFC12733]|uniref:Uncharacterized protein n=1 Tax=Calocera viscosa (strain TUFC12733) TaxID=1330018 RepID=A0A167PK65_CALVF|nr:hypothetical protein CALVIDRAFT_525848 [Calocera viscosa TUFC12733]
MDGFDADSAPASPCANSSTVSLSAALDTIHSGLSDLKLAESLFSPLCKTSEGENYSFTPTGEPDKTDKAKAKAVYAPEDEGRVEGGSGGGGGEMSAALKAAVIAAIREVEVQIGAPALVGGLRLIAVLEGGVVAQDTLERPKVFMAKPEDLAKVGENDEALQPAVDHKAGSERPPPSLDELGEERPCDYDLALLTTDEFGRELVRIVQPAYEYGKQLRRVELVEEEERRKDALRFQRQAQHDAVWEKNVERGKQAVDEECTAVPVTKRMEDAKLLLALNVHEGKQKAIPAIKKFLKKYGATFAKVGVKVGEELIEQAVEQAVNYA